MAKKKAKGRRPLKIKVRMEVMVRAETQEEALGKLEAIIRDQIEEEFESFRGVAPWIASKLVKDSELGTNARWWHPDAPRDIVKSHYNWTNRKRGGWKKDEKDITTDVFAGKIGMVFNKAAGKSVVAHRNRKGQFARKGGKRK